MLLHFPSRRMRPVFLFIDLLEDFFIHPPLSTRRAALVERVNTLAAAARAAGHPVGWVRQEFEPDLSDAFRSMRETGRRVTIKGTPGCRLLAELAQQPEDFEIVKRRYSAFFGTELDDMLADLGCTHLVVGGVNTHACIRTTAVDAYQRDYAVVFATEAITSYDAEFHRESFRYLVQSIGVPMSNAALEAWMIPAAEAPPALPHLGGRG